LSGRRINGREQGIEIASTSAFGDEDAGRVGTMIATVMMQLFIVMMPVLAVIISLRLRKLRAVRKEAYRNSPELRLLRLNEPE